jgi:hypothetical protein
VREGAWGRGVERVGKEIGRCTGQVEKGRKKKKGLKVVTLSM